MSTKICIVISIHMKTFRMGLHSETTTTIIVNKYIIRPKTIPNSNRIISITINNERHSYSDKYPIDCFKSIILML